MHDRRMRLLDNAVAKISREWVAEPSSRVDPPPVFSHRARTLGTPETMLEIDVPALTTADNKYSLEGLNRCEWTN